ncbi:MAG: flagellar export chaperone FliS [Magnetococcales bacterium]|nr:flagellar export chaperone FliS [Magnetococcales bacterium]
MSYGLRSYKASRANTAAREDLLILLYEGAIRFLERSIQEFEGKNLSEHKMFLRRGLMIVSELQSTLDFQKGGELAIQLFELYGYMLEQLTLANIAKEMEPIRRVVRQLNILLEGWRVAVAQYKAGGVSLSPAPVDGGLPAAKSIAQMG